MQNIALWERYNWTTAGRYAITVVAHDSGGTYTDSDPSNTVYYNVYDITKNGTHVTFSVEDKNVLGEGGSEIINISADTGYSLPNSITVSGASYTYDKSDGTIILSNPTGNVTITVVADTKLAAPVISIANSVVSWQEVNHADTYFVKSDGTTIITVT